MVTPKKDYSQTRGWIFLTLWAVLIAAGCIAKRGFNHPDLVVFFHVPAAVFLVMAWHQLSRPYRLRHQALSEAFLARRRQGSRPRSVLFPPR